jgi:hypothetical protein
MDLKTEDRVIARATSGLYAMHLHFSSPSPSFEKKNSSTSSQDEEAFQRGRPCRARRCMNEEPTYLHQLSTRELII